MADLRPWDGGGGLPWIRHWKPQNRIEITRNVNTTQTALRQLKIKIPAKPHQKSSKPASPQTLTPTSKNY